MDDVDILALIAGISGFCFLIVKLIGRSKCTNINCCWGGFTCIRDVKIEHKENGINAIADIEAGQNSVEG